MIEVQFFVNYRGKKNDWKIEGNNLLSLEQFNKRKRHTKMNGELCMKRRGKAIRNLHKIGIRTITPRTQKKKKSTKIKTQCTGILLVLQLCCCFLWNYIILERIAMWCGVVVAHRCERCMCLLVHGAYFSSVAQNKRLLAEKLISFTPHTRWVFYSSLRTHTHTHSGKHMS